MKDSFHARYVDLKEKLSALHRDAESLTRARANLVSILSSSHITRDRLGKASWSCNQYRKGRLSNAEALLRKIERRNQERLHRICPGVKAFRVQELDSRSIDAETVLGIRIDLLIRGRAIKPYFVFLKRIEPNQPSLAIHNHTLPSFLPVEGIIAKHKPLLVQSSNSNGQNLHAFVKELRRALVSFHLRKAAVERMQKQLEKAENIQDGSRAPELLQISAANSDVTEIELIWETDIMGRICLTEEGLLTRCVIHGRLGRMKEAEHALMSESRHISSLLPSAKSIQHFQSTEK